MVKSVLSTSHQGLRDWIFQRFTALIMVVYTFIILSFFLMHAHSTMNYIVWHSLFMQLGMKIATIVFISALLLHAWIGIWTIFTDYVPFFKIRLCLHAVVFLTLIFCFIASLLILWGV